MSLNILSINEFGQQKKLNSSDAVSTYIKSDFGFIVTGGTSSQFLKADGSIDSNTYLTSQSNDINNQTAITQSAGFKINGDGTLRRLYITGIDANVNDLFSITTPTTGGKLSIRNTTTTGPWIAAIDNTTTSNAVGMYTLIKGSDGYSIGAYVLRANNALGTGNVTSGNLFTIQNNTTNKFWIDFDGFINSSSLVGTGDRMLVTNSAGRVSTQAIPSGGSGSSINNSTALQTGANFNIDGNGTVGSMKISGLAAADTRMATILPTGDVSTQAIPLSLYTNDGTLTANRFIDGGGFNLQIDNLKTFTANASASSTGHFLNYGTDYVMNFGNLYSALPGLSIVRANGIYTKAVNFVIPIAPTTASTSANITLPTYSGTMARLEDIPGYVTLNDWDFWTERYFTVTTATLSEFTGTAILSGTNTTAIPSATLISKYPHGVFIRSSTTANSGYRYATTSVVGDLFGGVTKYFKCIWQPLTAHTNNTVRLGYHDATTSADAVDGAYFEIVNGVVSCKTANNSTRTTNATTTTLTINIHYTFIIEVNEAGTNVNFIVRNANTGAEVLNVNNTTNIPTTAGREFGTIFVATNSGTVASDIGILKYMGFGTKNAYLKKN